MLQRIIEFPRTSDARARLFIRLIVATFAFMIPVSAVHFFGFDPTGGPPKIVDFDVFYLAGKLAWAGRIEEAYRFTDFAAYQRAMTGAANHLPWTYPPQFDLFAALLALMPRGMSYVVFAAVSLAAYLVVMRKLAGAQFVTVLVLMYVPVLLTISGQNGLLTGALVGAACLGVLQGSAWAGLPLGLMVIKPHLAVALALNVVAAGRWGIVLVAAVTVLLTSALATLLLGPGVWTALLGAVGEATGFLANRQYQLFRMISPYAALRSLNVPAVLATAAQAISALAALGVTVAAQRRLPMREALGVATIATLLVSPYVYDYDLPILGVGMALLLPSIWTQGRPVERSAIYALTLFTTGFGIVQTMRMSLQGPDSDPKQFISLAGFALVALLVVAWRVVAREPNSERPPPRPAVPA